MKPKKYFIQPFCCFLFFSLSISLSAQDWARTYGGTGQEYGSAVQQTSDGGFIIAGSTSSFGAGSSDVYIVKTNSNGDTIWTKTFGGPSSDNGHSVQQTFDGGYIIGGATASQGSYDFYLIKTDAIGNSQWIKTIGSGGVVEQCFDVVLTKDSGYCAVGIKNVYGSGNTDIYLVRTNQNGDTLWTKTYDSSVLDYGYSLQQTADDGFIIACATYTLNGNHYNASFIRTNSAGDTLWTRIYYGNYSAAAYSVALTSDGGYILGGTSSENFFAVKVAANGTTQWSKEIDKGGGDRCFSIIQSSDGGYVMAGYTYTFSTDADVLIIKLDNTGNEMWSKRNGGIQWDEGGMIQSIAGGGYIICGTSNSDMYLIKTNCDNFPTANIAVLDTFCQGNLIGSTLFSNLLSGATYQWVKNDTLIVGAVLPDNAAIGNGQYELLITDSTGCSNESNTITIYFPKPNFHAYPREICPGDSVILGDWFGWQQSYPDYDWDFGDGTTGTGDLVKHVYIDTGTYIITRTVRTSNGSCNPYRDSVIVSTTALPPVDFDLLVNSRNVFPNRACPGDKIEFIPYAYAYLFVQFPFFDAASWMWDFGDGATDTVPFPVHYYAGYGTYTITFTVTNHCGNSDSVSTTILIDSTLNSSAYFTWTNTQGIINGTVNACEQITFEGNSGLTYDWNFGDGSSLTTSSDTTSHAFANVGNYNVQLITTNGCGNSDTVNRTIIVGGVCTAIPSIVPNGNSVLVYPNPFTDAATIQISLSAQHASLTSFHLEIFDLQGRQVKQLTTEKLKFMIDRGNLPGGMYFYKLINDNKTLVTGKFIVQ